MKREVGHPVFEIFYLVLRPKPPSSPAWVDMQITSAMRANPSGQHSLAEVAQALGRMSPADMQRVKLIAMARADGLRACGWEDLLQEAILRMLDGGRRWPMDVPIIAFLAQTMRSIASDHRRRDAIFESGDVVTGTTDATSLDDRLDSTRRVGEIYAFFAGDAAVVHLIDGLIAGETASDTQRRAGLSAQSYDAARKRYWREIAKLNGEQ